MPYETSFPQGYIGLMINEFVADRSMWKRYSAKLPNSEALKVFREVIDYITEKLKPRTDDTDVWREGVAFFSENKEFLTIEVTTKGLRIHFYPSAGMRAMALLNRIVCVSFCSLSKHSCILLTLTRSNYWRPLKPEHDQTNSCQSPEFSNMLALIMELARPVFQGCSTG